MKVVTLLGLLLGCAHAHTASPAAGAPLGERVAAVLTHHHISPPAETALRTRLRARLETALGCPRVRAPHDELDLLRALYTDDFGVVAKVATSCGVEAPLPARWPTLLLNALAQAYDPHSRYLDAGALTRFRAQPHAALGPGARLRAELVTHADHRIGLLTLPSVYLHAEHSASADLRDALHELQAQGAEVMVLDLRGNGGGPIREAANTFGMLAGPGTLGYVRQRDQPLEPLAAPPAPAAWRGPLLVRIDAGTASVAELLAAALQDSGRALLVGQPTYGKGTGQALIPLGSPADATQGAVDVSDRRFYRRDGRALQCAGVGPDLVVPAPGHARECTRPDALQPDRLPPPLPTAGVVTLQTRADSEPVRAAIAQLTQPVPVR